MKRNKILLLNQGHTPNYGDIAINYVIESFLHKNDIDADFFPFWSEQEVFGKNYDQYNQNIKTLLFKFHSVIDFFNKISVKTIVSHIKDYDAIVIGGGELIGPHKGFNSSLKIWSDIAHKYNIPLYVFGVSGDLNMSSSMLKRNKKSLKKCSFICVRDGYSHEIFTNFYKVNNICMPDVVFSYNKLATQKNTSKQQKRDSLLVVPIEFVNTIQTNLKLKNETEYIQYLFNLMNEQLGELNNVIITTSVYNDDCFAEKFYNYAKENVKSNINLSYVKYSNIHDYITLLNQSKTVLSARMHALILALLNGCRISVIPFKQKLITFEKEYSNNTLENVENESLNGLALLCNLIKK